MRYRILGPLSVSADEQSVAVTAGRDRIVLAMLLLNPGRVVSAGALVDAVWGEDPPATARNQMQTCVSRLRRALPAGAIGSDPVGYRLDVRPGELDAAEFGRLVAAARERRDAALYRQALDLWRGGALEGLDSHAVRLGATVLDDQYVTALADWADLELAAGRTDAPLGELATAVDRFPLHERLRGRLMLALYRAGRPADALAEYRRARATMKSDLGLEPGSDLQHLHAAILTGGLPEPARPAPAVVRCLPRTVGDFTGRAAVVRRLVGAIAGADPSGPVIVAVDGMAGSGKTTVALHVAALVGERFPDAHLFVDLHGHSERQPLEPAAALLILLRQLGVGAERVPSELAERVEVWRTELAARRVLVVFDNVASSEQVADLLPTAAGSLALVTGRRRLAGLDGAYPESLPVLPEDEAVALLARIAGERVVAEPEAAAEVVGRCGGLPLALRLAGARLAHRPGWRVADLVRRMGASALPELAAENRTVVGAFALSFGQLPEPAQRVFRLLGLYPGPSFDALAVAALGDLPLEVAEDLLDDLVDVHLVDEPGAGVFRLHDLIRQYATVLAVELPAADRQAAVVRALDLEVHAAIASVPAARREDADRDLGRPAPTRPDLVDALTDTAGRLERIRPSLGVMLDAAVAAGRPEYTWMLARAVWRRLWAGGYTDDIAALFTVARDAARRTGDRRAQAMTANYLASTFFLHGRYDEARVLLEESVRLRQETDDIPGLIISLGNLSAIHVSAGRYADAVAAAQRGLRLVHRTTKITRADLLLDPLSQGYSELGQHAEAIRCQRRRLQIVSQDRDYTVVPHTMLHLVAMRRRAGDIAPEAAERALRVVLRHTIRNGNVPVEADTRAELGDLLREQGRFAEALRELRLSLVKLDDVGVSRGRPMILNMFGRATAEAGDPIRAAEIFRQALDLAGAHSQPLEQGRAWMGLGDCLAGEPEAAREQWAEAHRVFTRLGVPQRFDVERRLAGLVPVGG